MEEAASFIRDLAIKLIKQNGRFTFVLSGGNTPRSLFEKLAQREFREDIDWSHVYVFWGDERYVPMDHPKSNYRMARDALLSKVSLLEKNIYPMPTEMQPVEKAADHYEHTLRDFFQVPTTSQNFASFDLILLGMGEDGHTASLIAGKDILKEKKRWVAAVEVPPTSPIKKRITVTLPLINNAENVMFLVSGENKREMLEKILKGDENTARSYPAGLVAPRGNLFWFTDISL
jgi:6-phosphogluconolactonase